MLGSAADVSEGGGAGSNARFWCALDLLRCAIPPTAAPADAPTRAPTPAPIPRKIASLGGPDDIAYCFFKPTDHIYFFLKKVLRFDTNQNSWLS